MATNKEIFNPFTVAGKPVTQELRRPGVGQEGNAPVWDNVLKRWKPGITGGGSTTLEYEGFETDGIEDTFTLSEADAVPYIVEINGVVQRPGTDYLVSGNSVVFNSAPSDSPGGVNLYIYYALDVVLSTDFLQSFEVDVSGLLALNFQGRKQRIFVGSGPISSDKSIDLINNSFALVFSLHIQVTGTVVLTFPESFIMQSTDVRWNSSDKELTLLGLVNSSFELSAVFDGTFWKLKCSDSFV